MEDDGLAKEHVIREAAKFDALANAAERLREMGIELLDASNTHTCPLCTHEWPSAGVLREKVTSKELMSHSIKEASDALDSARAKAQQAAAVLAEAKRLQLLHDQFMKKLNAAKSKLSSFEASTHYLRVMGDDGCSNLTAIQIHL